MRLAIISTTIHGERGYLPFDRLAAESKFSDVVFIVAGDLKSAPFDTSAFRCRVEYLDAVAQGRYRSSEAIGWNKIMRRNIALLRAIALKPDYILTIDDDNVPDDGYFDRWHAVLTTPVARLAVPSTAGGEPVWHNYLASSDAPVEIYPRGFPMAFRGGKSTEVRSIPEAIPPEKIGLFQGISLGHPDIDAATRIVYPHPISRVREMNYCLRDVWSPYNTQNTMYAKILFPLAFVWPQCGRYDDIYSSFAWQQLLFSNSMYVHVGEALNTQGERRRGVLVDLAHEVEGYLNAHAVWMNIREIDERDPVRFIERLAAMEPSPLPEAPYPIVTAAQQIMDAALRSQATHPIISRHGEFLRAYLQDLAEVL